MISFIDSPDECYTAIYHSSGNRLFHRVLLDLIPLGIFTFSLLNPLLEDFSYETGAVSP